MALKARVEDGNLLVEVEDTGIGIAPEEVSKVFDKFFRSEDVRVRDITGTGLGLALAHEIVRLHGGNLTVRSELNAGSTFVMTLERFTRLKCWNIMPICLRMSRRSVGSASTMFCPSQTTSPSVTSTRRLIHRSNVDFPDPLRPITTRNSPSSTEKLTSRSATVPSG